MPSRPLSPSPAPASLPQTHHKTHLLAPLSVAATAAFSLILFLITLLHKFTRSRTAPSDSKPPYRFSYSTLRRATASFSASHLIGRGGFGSVYSGTLPHTHQEIAVKLLDSGSLQGEREFQNELFFSAKIDSPFIVSVIGFCSDKKRRRMLLVYDLMQNGNLQNALLKRECVELMEWKMRFSIAVDIAKGLEYLHELDPPVIHGDIKPSNVLLDRRFSARIGDFGLARMKSENAQFEVEVKVDNGLKEEEKMDERKKKEEELKTNECVGVEECGFLVEETESVTTGFEEFNVGVDQSPENSVTILETSPEKAELAMTSPETGMIAGSAVLHLEGNFDRASSIESVKEMTIVGKKNDKMVKSISGRNWWWKQENEVGENGNVKDYVMEWIGSQVKNERPTSEWIAASSSSGTIGKWDKKKKSKRRLEWWISMDEEKNPNPKSLKKDKKRPPREWWKEEYCDELARKKKKKKKLQRGTMSCDEKEDDLWPVDEALYREKKKKSKNQSRESRNSIEGWLDGLSGDLWRARQNSYDSASGEIPKSGNMSSTPSTRGTMCYTAPEYGFGDDLSEKCDVYSYGVLLLVLISGRRPFQVTSSPLLEFRRANLLSWARHLARAGKLIELVDQSIQGLDQEQALVCIRVALLCLQKLPARRPFMKDVLGMLTGKLELPKLPSELSPQALSRFR